MSLIFEIESGFPIYWRKLQHIKIDSIHEWQLWDRVKDIWNKKLEQHTHTSEKQKYWSLLRISRLLDTYNFGHFVVTQMGDRAVWHHVIRYLLQNPAFDPAHDLTSHWNGIQHLIWNWNWNQIFSQNPWL